MSDPEYAFDQGPTPISYTIPLATLTYMLRLNARGMIEGPLGDQKLAAAVEPAIEALHTILSGGEVTITIARKGDPDVKRQLDALLTAAHKDANEINAKAGYYVTIQV